jgi:hypothetical protein
MPPDVVLTDLPQATTNIPPEGISIEYGALYSAESGQTYKSFIMTGVGPSAWNDQIAFAISADKTVRVLTEGWEPVIDGDYITGFRACV